MPSLRQLDCQIEWANTSTAFEEYGTIYGDGVVETYIAIPSSPQAFSVRVRSKGYIFDGLAVLVFMDGEYQCNRNRLNLKPHKNGLPRSATEIDFRLRQKEKPVGDGSFIGREWRFDTHNLLPEVPQDAHSGHFENLGMIEILVLRCKSTANDDNRSTSSSGVDADPMGKDFEANNATSVFEDGTQERDSPPGFVAPAAAEDNSGGGMLCAGLFDGAHDQPENPNFGGDGPADGYWAYHPYQHDNGIYNDRQQWRPQPSYNAGPPPAGVPPQPYPPQPLGPEKRVHFEMGGPPNTRFGPSPTQQQRPNIPNPPASGQVPLPDPSTHGAGQQGGYPLHPYPVPFEAIPPVRAPQMAAGYGIQAGWGGQGYMPYPMYPGYFQGYGHHPQAYYQGQEYGHGQAGPVQGAVANQGVNTSGSAGQDDPAKEQNNQDDGWGAEKNAGGSSGNAGGGDDWEKGNSNDNPDNEWFKNGAGNDTTNTNDNDNWNTDADGNKDESWEDSNNADDNNGNNSGGRGWGDTIEVTTPKQNDNAWDNKDTANSNQDHQSWDKDNSKNQDQNQNQDGNTWDGKDSKPSWRTISKGDAAFNLEQTTQQSIPGAFPSGQPRALYGPHGPYYVLETTATAGFVQPEVEEEPRYDVPLSHIVNTGSTHQVQPGRGYLYVHKRCTPSYIDSVEEPYARFVFKYRTREQLAAEIGVYVDVEPSSDADFQELATKSKEEIIGLLLRAKSALGGKIPEPPEKTKAALDEAVGLKPTVVPAPARRVSEYKIPSRPVSKPQRPLGLGLRIPGLQDPRARQQGSPRWASSGLNNVNVPSRPLTPEGNTGGGGGGWSGQDQNQNQGQNWGAGGGGIAGGIGDPGSRPVSPVEQSGGYGDAGASGGDGGGGRPPANTVW